MADDTLDRALNAREQREQALFPDAAPGVDPWAHVRAVAHERHGYVVDDDWEERLHALLGAPYPCPDRARFDALWADLERELGGGAAGAHRWDADPAFARAAFCAARHSGARRVVETGVARGVTTRCFLEALPADGHLWSIDLLPRDEAVAAMSRAAVPARLRDRWTYVAGSSRNHLEPLLASLGAIDVFAHDSHHTGPTMRMEFAAAWPRLRPGGVLLSDDVHENAAWAELAATDAAAGRAVVGQEEGKAGLLGVVVRPGSSAPPSGA
jgi:SAM-dependent methyltransferase